MNSSYACTDVNSVFLGAGNYPDLPLNQYASGQSLGIVTPNLATSYLLVAYRYFNNHPLTAEEQKTALSVWSYYLLNTQYFYIPPTICNPVDISQTCANNKNSPVYKNYQSIPTEELNKLIKKFVNDNKAYFDWRTARLAALNLPTNLPIPTAKALNSIYSFEYSTIDEDSIKGRIRDFYSALALKEDNIDDISGGPGFNYLVIATQRLQVLEKNLNDQNKSIWIQAQQQIFKRSSEGSEQARALLKTFSPTISPLLQKDIQYSIAASYLYDENPKNIEQAAQLFAQLAKDKNYPWYEWADYLHYRALNIAVNTIQQNSDTDDACMADPSCKNMTEQAYHGMLSLSEQAQDLQVKAAAKAYISIISMRTQLIAPGVFDALVKNNLKNITKDNFNNMIFMSNTLQPNTDTDFGLWLADTISLRNNDDYDNTNAKPDYLKVFNEAYQHSQANPNNLAWLWLATTTLTYGNATQQDSLVKAVLNITPANPAFVSLRVALITNLDKLQEVTSTTQKLNLIDTTLQAIPTGEQFSVTQFLLNERANVATSFTDFIKHAFIFPQGNVLLLQPQDEDNNKYGANYITDNAANIINTLPPSMLLELANMPQLPKNYVPVIYANLWVRSILLNDPALEKLVSIPAMKYNPILAKTIKGMQTATDPDEKQTLFISALLHYPNLSPYVNLSWYETWIPESDKADVGTSNPIILDQQPLNTAYNNWLWNTFDSQARTLPPAFLTPEQKTEYLTKINQLNNLESAGTYLQNSLVDLANRHPNDQRYAELLAMYINYTRFSYGNSSKPAFITLKKLYPNSKWAKETKYYY